ncbi:MAG: D-alanyl-D-alanine endopeptidase [Gallionella sp.]
MKKRIWMPILLGYALASHGAHAETGSHHKQHKASRASLSGGTHTPSVRSNIAYIFDEQTQLPIYDKHSREVAPIASISKLMTAMVVLDAMLPLDEEVSVEETDHDRIKGTRSRLQVGMTFTRNELLKLALMASENRAASALARSYPGGKMALVAAMNAKASELGMQDTKFLDPTGLSRGNVSTAQDLVKMVSAARNYPLIHRYTTSASHSVDGWGGRELRFNNTNPLVRNVSWDIGVSKTGYISEAGLCLVMEAKINQRPVIIVLLNSWGKRTRIGDANRLKRWMESANARSRGTRQG